MINTKLLKKLDIKKYKKRIIKELKTPRIYSLKSTLSTISLTYDKEKLKKFNKKYNGLDSYIKNLSEENDVLIDSYNRFKKFNSNYIEKSYRDLIGEYKDKGYKSFDFKEKQNLFKPNPLLMENKKIKNYFAFNLKKSNLPSFINKFIKRKENKYFSFLKKEESLVKEELIKHKLEKPEKNYSLLKEKLNQTQSYDKPNMIDIIKDTAMNIYLKEENKKIKEYNQSIQNIIPKTRTRYSSLKERNIPFFLINKKNKSKFNPNNISPNLDDSTISPFSNSRKEEKSTKNIIKINKKSILNSNINFYTFQKNKIKNLKKKKTFQKFSDLITCLNSEDNQNKILNDLQEIDLKLFERKDLEFIAKTYCKRFLRYNEMDINNMMIPKYSDKDLIDLILNFINKVDNSVFLKRTFSSNNKTLRNKVLELNHESYNLKKRFALFIANK